MIQLFDIGDEEAPEEGDRDMDSDEESEQEQEEEYEPDTLVEDETEADWE